MNSKLKRLKHSSWFHIVTPVITLLFGIVGGKILEAGVSRSFDTGAKAIAASLFTVGVLSVAVLIFVTAFARRAEEREEAWLQSIGVPAEIVFEDGSEGRANYFHKVLDFIRQASEGDEILIMTQHRARPPHNETSPHTHIRDQYCKLLTKKVREEGVTYRRLVCFDTNTPDLGISTKYVAPWLVDHFREMLVIKKTRASKISVKTSSKKIGADIFVIPGKLGVVVLDVYDSQTGVVYTNSSLFFHSPPNKQVINQLHEWFLEIDSQADTVSIDDVPQPLVKRNE